MNIFAYFVEYNRYLNLIGIGVILLIAFLCSRKRSAIDYKLVGIALALQFGIALAMLKTAIGAKICSAVATGVNKIFQCTDAGSSFVFGNLVNPNGSWGFIFAFKALPIVIFFGALVALLFHFKVIQAVVGGVNWLLQPLLGTSGAETLDAIATSFLGQTSAPMLIRNYLKGFTNSEMLTVMVSGMACISGALIILYAAMGIPVNHLLASSVMAIPSALLISKILYPETENPETKGAIKVAFEPTSKNMFDALASGTSDGLSVALIVGAMLISFIALIALANALLSVSSEGINWLLAMIGASWQIPLLSLNMIFAYLFAPFAYLLGFSGSDALIAGELLGTKLVVNEMVAYGQLCTMMLSERTIAILTYALCGFANFSSIGIQLGCIGALAPEKRATLSKLGLIAVLGGTLSNLLSAMVAALLL
jgi:CNT family concentrative nucleoside transporter